MASIGTLGITPTPTKALALDMDKTALNQDRRPETSQDPDQMQIAIDRCTARGQAVLGKQGTEGSEMGGAFRHLGGSVHNRESGCIHHRKDPFAFVDVCAIKEQMLMLG